MQRPLIPARRTALCLALAAFPFSASPLELGEIEVRSALGEKLDARIPLRRGEDEWFHATCLSLARKPVAGLPPLVGGVLSVERRRNSSNLRLRTTEPVNDPAFGFSVTSSCADAMPQSAREFTVLLDPPRVGASPKASAPLALAPASTPVVRAQAPAKVRAPPAAAEQPRPAPPPRAAPAPRATPEPARAPSAPPAVAAPSEPPRRPPQFLLRLTTGNIDVARTRQFDDKSRSALRERLLLLDSDDQVAAMLSMRDNLRRLEARVAELQLKLASMPPSLAQAAPAPKAEPAPPPKVAAPPLPVPKVELKVEPPAPKVESPAVAAIAEPPAPAKIAPPAATAPIETAPAPKAEPPAPQAPVPATAKPGITAKPAPAPEPDFFANVPGGRHGVVAAIFLLLLALFGILWWRHRQNTQVASEPAGNDELDAASTGMDTEIGIAPPGGLDDEPPLEIAAPVRAEVSTDATLTTRLDDDTEAIRRRYIEERFPEIRERTIVLDDAGSIVKGARLFYEDGAIPRAVELLRFATEDRPDEVRPWLALFEIYRLERLTGEYAELAFRFRERFGETPQWVKVKAFGREIDPSTSMYQDTTAKTLETIGPREARMLAAQNADPVAENWLEAPMDFENEVFATELRRSLMARAGIDERDLVPNPMPALRSVEMFSVG